MIECNNKQPFLSGEQRKLPKGETAQLAWRNGSHLGGETRRKGRHFRAGGGAPCRDLRCVGPSAEEGTCKGRLRDSAWWGAEILWIKLEDSILHELGRWDSDCKGLQWNLKCLSSAVRMRSCRWVQDRWGGGGGKKIAGQFLGLLFLYEVISTEPHCSGGNKKKGNMLLIMQHVIGIGGTWLCGWTEKDEEVEVRVVVPLGEGQNSQETLVWGKVMIFASKFNFEAILVEIKKVMMIWWEKSMLEVSFWNSFILASWLNCRQRNALYIHWLLGVGESGSGTTGGVTWDQTKHLWLFLSLVQAFLCIFSPNMLEVPDLDLPIFIKSNWDKKMKKWFLFPLYK